MTRKFSKASERHFNGVHPDLIAVARKTLELSPYDFMITCGLRTKGEQRILVQTGKSSTMNSRHLPGKKNKMSHAIDFAVLIDGKITWDFKYYKAVASAFKKASKLLSIPIEWGGDWKSFIDGPHVQLPWAQYPG